MSMYNALFGFSPACFFILPMLGRKPEDYPRFRDCYVTEDNHIAIYTRVGGGNRDCGFGEEVLYDDPNYIKTYDDDFDSTYGTYEFSVPEKWKADFDLILQCRFSEVSDEYVAYVEEFYPKLAENGTVKRQFDRKEGNNVKTI